MSLWLGILSAIKKATASPPSPPYYFLFSKNNGSINVIDGNNLSGSVSMLPGANALDYINSSSTTLVAADGGKVFTSTNLTSWTTLSVSTNNINDIKYDGNNTTLPSWTRWPLPVSLTSNNYSSFVPGVISINNNLFIVGVNYGIRRSTDDGFTWTQVSASNSFLDIVFKNNIYIGISSISSTSDMGEFRIARSTDGITWNNISYPATASGLGCISLNAAGDYFTYSCIGSGPNTIDRGGSGRTYYSTDGLTWNRIPILTTMTITSIINVGSEYYALEYGGQIYSSSNSMLSWSNRSSSGDSRNLNIAYGKNIWVKSIQDASYVKTSTDLLTWTTRNVDLLYSGEVSYNPSSSMFAIVGQINAPWSASPGNTAAVLNFLSSATQQAVSTSTDGINWIKENLLSTWRTSPTTIGTGSNGKRGYNRNYKQGFVASSLATSIGTYAGVSDYMITASFINTNFIRTMAVE